MKTHRPRNPLSKCCNLIATKSEGRPLHLKYSGALDWPLLNSHSCMRTYTQGWGALEGAELYMLYIINVY